MELDFFGNLSPFFIALVILVVLKLKLWRNVETINWPQRICGLILGPTIIYSIFLLNIFMDTIVDNQAAYAGLFLILYLIVVTPIFAAIVSVSKVRAFIKILVIALACHIVCLFGLFLFTDNPTRAADLVKIEVLSVLAVLATIFATSYWAYIKNWPRIDIQSKIGRHE